MGKQGKNSWKRPQKMGVKKKKKMGVTSTVRDGEERQHALRKDQCT